MKKIRFLTGLVAMLAALVLVAGIISPAGVLAADLITSSGSDTEGKEKVAELVEFSVSKNVRVSKTITDELGGTTVKLKTVYPYVKVAGETALSKAIRKTIKSVAYTAVYRQIKKELAAGDVLPKDAVVNIEITYNVEESTQCGNIGSFVFTKSAYVEGGAYPTNETLVVNVDLATGRKLTLSSMFKSYTKVRSFFAKSAKAYADGLYREAESLFEFNAGMKDEFAFFGDLKLSDVRKAIDINSVKFNWDGVTLYFDETDGLWPHAYGTQTVFIPYDDVAPYIKSTKSQLFRPASVAVIKLEYNAGTPYSWVGGPDVSCLRLVYDGDYAKNPSPMLVGGRMVKVVVFKAVKAGKVNVNYKLARFGNADGDAAETYSKSLIINPDLFVAEASGETR